MKHLTTLVTSIITAATLCIAADFPKTILKAEYRYDFSSEGVHESDNFILQIANGESRFYSVKTQFIDSLMATPGGPDMIAGLVLDEINKNGGLKLTPEDMAAGRLTITIENSGNIPEPGQMFQIYKHFGKGQMDLFDNVANEDYTYQVPMNDLHWEIADSTKTVLGYECQMATASYHGRNWTAWFSPEIAVQDGPWQLFGLPGLIMEAATDDGDHSFTIEGLQQAAEQILPIPGDKNFIKTERIKLLRYKSKTSVNLLETDYNDKPL